MKFKVLVAGLLAAILSVNIFTAYTIIQEEKKQTRLKQIAIEVQIIDSQYNNEFLTNGAYIDNIEHYRYEAAYINQQIN